MDKTAHQGTFALQGFKFAPDNQDIDCVFFEAEDDAVDGNVEFIFLYVVLCHCNVYVFVQDADAKVGDSQIQVANATPRQMYNTNSTEKNNPENLTYFICK
jgi:hypothetical protein